MVALRDKALGKGYLAVVERDKDSRQQQEAADTITVTYQVTITIDKQFNEGFQRVVEAEVGRLRRRVGVETVRLVEVFGDAVREVEASEADGDNYITATEAAAIGGVSVSTATRYLDDGWWKGRKVGRQWRVPRDQAFTRKRDA